MNPFDPNSFTGPLILWCDTHAVHFSSDDQYAKHREDDGCEVSSSCSTGASKDTYASCAGRGKACAMKGYV